MKKSLLILSALMILVALLISTNSTKTPSKIVSPRTDTVGKIDTNKIKTICKGTSNERDVYIYVMDGHDFIGYLGVNSDVFTHSPNCKTCKSNK